MTLLQPMHLAVLTANIMISPLVLALARSGFLSSEYAYGDEETCIHPVATPTRPPDQANHTVVKTTERGILVSKSNSTFSVTFTTYSAI